MIELYQLRQLIAFADAKTLSKAAEELHLSQPALSRNMKKIEEDLEIPLFNRHKNKMSLNKNGDYVVQLARDLIDEANDLVKQAQEFDRKNRTLSVGTCAPAPLWYLVPLLARIYPHARLQTEMEGDKVLYEKLDGHEYQLIVTHIEPDTKDYFFKECGKESILFALPKGHRFARRKSLALSDMNGENMLLMDDIGFWSVVKEKMPDSRFLMQSDRFSFNELVHASSLPSFTSDLAERFSPDTSGRIHIPISDPESSVTYYLVCLKENKRQYMNVFSSLSIR